MHSQEDRRIRRTKVILKTALLHLLEKKDLNDISVSELAEHADVNRGTFYSHYQDVFGLFSEVEQKVLDDLFNLLSPVLEETQTWKSVLRSFLEYVSENEDLISIVFRVNNASFFDKFISRIHDLSEKTGEVTYSTEKREYYEYLYVYSFTGLVNVMQSWQKKGHPHSLEEMAQFMELLIFRTFPSLIKLEE